MIEREPRPPRRRLFSMGAAPWVDIVPEAVERTNREPDHRRLHDWDLVLTARRLPHRLERRTSRIFCPQPLAQRALDEIVSYEQENLQQSATAEPAPLRRPGPGRDWVTMLVLLLLCLFQMLAEQGGLPGLPLELPLMRLGKNDSTMVLLDGQWWRPITALTLHADAGHLFGNVLFGGVFCTLLCRELGVGLGWFLVVGGGWLGNWLNAWLRGPGHVSLGASTAVFAAVGILAAYRSMRGLGPGLKPVLVPLAAGMTFLAFLGASGENTDLAAHLLGFAVGIGAGAGTGLISAYSGLPPLSLERTFGAAAALMPLAAWAAALSWRWS